MNEWRRDVDYRRFHEARYAFLVEILASVARSPRPNRSLRILDVGPSFELLVLRRRFPETVIDTLGFQDPQFPLRPRETHVEFDLNDTFFREKWPTIEPHDVVVLAEVIEHLYTAPETVLQFLAGCLAEEGCLLLQTPNAASLAKRLMLLAGRNPYMRIRTTRVHPGHFREYTVKELLDIGEEAGLVAAGWWVRDYFAYESFVGTVYRRICEVLPQRLRNGITICFRKSSDPTPY